MDFDMSETLVTLPYPSHPRPVDGDSLEKINNMVVLVFWICLQESAEKFALDLEDGRYVFNARSVFNAIEITPPPQRQVKKIVSAFSAFLRINVGHKSSRVLCSGSQRCNVHVWISCDTQDSPLIAIDFTGNTFQPEFCAATLNSYFENVK